jgi:hypothetical protein
VCQFILLNCDVYRCVSDHSGFLVCSVCLMHNNSRVFYDLRMTHCISLSHAHTHLIHYFVVGYFYHCKWLIVHYLLIAFIVTVIEKDLLIFVTEACILQTWSIFSLELTACLLTSWIIYIADHVTSKKWWHCLFAFNTYASHFSIPTLYYWLFSNKYPETKFLITISIISIKYTWSKSSCFLKFSRLYKYIMLHNKFI